jgi:prepilin-type N-terminal cleavage/methylation domain-containing protein
MLRNKKGFTLVELLAVITILGVILAIAMPRIANIQSGARADSLRASLKLIIKGIDYAVMQGDAVTTGSNISPAPYGASAADITTINIAAGLNPVTLSSVAINATGKFAGCTVSANTTFVNANDAGRVTCN